MTIPHSRGECVLARRGRINPAPALLVPGTGAGEPIKDGFGHVGDGGLALRAAWEAVQNDRTIFFGYDATIKENDGIALRVAPHHAVKCAADT